MNFWGKGIVETKCPYYEREAEYSITCEGIIEGTENVVRFKSKHEKESYQEDNCFSYPNKCPVSCMLDKKYQK